MDDLNTLRNSSDSSRKQIFEDIFLFCHEIVCCVYFVERCGAVVKRRTRDREVPGSIPTNCKCCFLEQETLSTLLSTGFYPGKRGPHGRLVLDY